MKKKKRLNLLIIGHKGYVGTSLIKYFSKKKKYFNINGIDSNLFYFNNYYKNKNNFVDEQISDLRKIKKKMLPNNINVVIYLAAVSNDPMGSSFKNATKSINFTHCIKIAKMAKNLGVSKFIFASSCSMYGKADNSKRKETDMLNPLTDYSISKVKTENFLSKIANKDFKIISLRFATAAGLSDNLRLDLVFNDFVATAVKKKKIELLSSGDSWRPLIHVDDMSRVIYWSIKYKNKKNFLAINIGSDKWTFKIIDLAKKISKIIGNVKVVILNEANIDKRSYKVDFSLFKKIAPKYQPKKNFVKAVNELKEFLFKEKKNLNNFRNSKKWSRLKCLNYLINKQKINRNLFWLK